MKRVYKKKSKLINKTGYTPGYDTEKNPVNYIPSENITMANTPYPLKGTPLDENGNPIGKSIIMFPGEDYNFNGASYVEERPFFQKGGRNKIAPSLENQLLNKYVTPSTNRAMARAKQQGIRTGIHNGGLDAIRHSSSAAATSSVLPSWANSLPGVLPLNILATNIAGAAHEVNSPNSFKEHASDLYNNFVGSVVGTLPITEENKHDLLIKAQKNGILSDMGDKRPLNNKQTRPSNIKQNNMNNTTNSAFNRNIRGKRNFNQFLLGDTPEFRKGGQKSDWISDKISTLVREGYPQKQAVAIAYSMYENKHGNGGYQLPMYQLAGIADPNKPTPESIAAYEEQQKKAQSQGIAIPNSALGDETSGMTNPELMPTSAQLRRNNMQNTATNNYDGNGNAIETDNTLDIKGEQPFQFSNQYPGFDIPTAASTLGSSIESGDTLGTVASGLKLATGLARNFFGGMGQERRKNFVEKQQAEKQREGMTGAGMEKELRFGGYYQEGGMQPGMEQPQGGDIQQQVAEALQQGASPEEVMQQLIQMGMPEDQAMSLVQGIMEQMQPSTPQLKRGGMMYYQDGGEGEYGYEEENYMINKPSLMGRQQNFSQPTNASMETNTEPEIEEEEAPSYDKNSARDTWVAKTGMPWSEAKKLGYTSGSAKDNMKLLSELNDPRFRKEYLRKSSPKSEKTYNGGQLKEVVVTRPKKNNYVDPYKGWYNDSEGDLRNAKGVMVGLDGKPLNFLERNFSSSITLPPLDENGRRMKPLRQMPTAEESNAYTLAQSKNKVIRQKELEDVWGKIPSSTPFIKYQDGGEQQISQQVAQAMQQGMQPQEAMAMLMESGMTEDQAIQLVQAIMEQIQQQGQQMEEGTPQMKRGGEMIKRKDGSYSRRGLWDNIRDNEGSGKKPTKEMLEQEAKIKKEYQEGGMEPEADPAQEMMQQVAQMLEQGANPQEVIQMLVEAGVPEEQAVQMVQSIMQQMQGGQSQQPTPQMRRGGRYCQEGGEIMDEQMEGGEMMEEENEGYENESAMSEQIEDQVEQALQQGADPQEILQQLVQMGMPQEEAMQMIQEILQEMQGGKGEVEGTPQMSKGGKYMRALVGKTIKNYTYNPKTDSYIVSYE